MSIDSFRALDTTRIFAARTTLVDRLEAKLVRTFPEDFTVNRIGGGKPDGLRIVFLEAELKQRQLVPRTGSPSPEGLTAPMPPVVVRGTAQDILDEA